MNFLKVIGPDALINQFTVNCLNPDGSSQTNIDLVNELQDLIFNELTCKHFNRLKPLVMILPRPTLSDQYSLVGKSRPRFIYCEHYEN